MDKRISEFVSYMNASDLFVPVTTVRGNSTLYFFQEKLSFEYAKKLGVVFGKMFSRFVTVGFLNDNINKNKGNRIALDLEIAFLLKMNFPEPVDTDGDTYTVKLPSDTKWVFAPKNQEIVGKYFFDIEGKFFLRGNTRIDFKKELKILLERNLLQIKPLSGWFERTWRRSKWSILYPLVTTLTWTFRLLCYLCTGDNAQLKRESTFSKLFAHKIEKTRIVVSDFGLEKATFYGLTIPPVPLMTYSLAHLSFYIWCRLFGIDMPAIKSVFFNPFLTVIYAIASFIFFKNVLGGLCRILFGLLGKSLLYTEHPKRVGYLV